MIRTRHAMMINEVHNVNMIDKFSRIKIIEDVHGPRRMLFKKSQVSSSNDLTLSSVQDFVSWEEEGRSAYFDRSDEEGCF